MPGPGSAVAGPAIMCFGAIILIGTAVVVVPSLISVFTPDGSERGFGSGNSRNVEFHLIILKMHMIFSRICFRCYHVEISLLQ